MSNSKTGLPPEFQFIDLVIHQGSDLTGQAKVEFELMLACAIFDEPKCQNCLANRKRLNPSLC